MKRKAKKALVLVVGIIFILLGLLGLALPILQGLIFLIIGLILISFSFPGVRVWTEKRIENYPHLLIMIKRVENWLVGIIGEI